jgi:transcriptional regulator of acetoin/glycerol metabolism
LRARVEEIPWLIAAEAGGLSVSPRFIEACLMREWPGNVRELLAEVRAAVDEARLTKSAQVRSAHLRTTAGERVRVEEDEVKPASTSPRDVTKAQLQAALEAHGTVTAAAKALGLHRNQVHRLLSEFGLKGEKQDSPHPDPLP